MIGSLEVATGTTPVEAGAEWYSAALRVDPEGPRVQLRGMVATANPASVLNPFFDRAHQWLLRSGATEVRVDLTELEFCNASGFTSLVYWLQKVQAAGDQGYRLRFISSPARKWQRTSLLALSCYNPGSVEIG